MYVQIKLEHWQLIKWPLQTYMHKIRFIKIYHKINLTKISENFWEKEHVLIHQLTQKYKMEEKMRKNERTLSSIISFWHEVERCWNSLCWPSQLTQENGWMTLQKVRVKLNRKLFTEQFIWKFVPKLLSTFWNFYYTIDWERERERERERDS